jgi:hypothetical protein
MSSAAARPRWVLLSPEAVGDRKRLEGGERSNNAMDIILLDHLLALVRAVADHAPSAIDEIAGDRASHDAKPDDSNGLVLESSFPAVEFD